MKLKWILAGALALAAIGYGAFSFIRYPAERHSLADRSLSTAETEAVRAEAFAKPDKKILVAVFSRTGRTRHAAEAIAEKTGAELFEIEKAGGYSLLYAESNLELLTDARPALARYLAGDARYDIVFVGYPVWWHAAPAPVSSFLAGLPERTLVIPFATSVSSPIEETLPSLRHAAAGLAVYGGKRIGNEADISPWLRELGL